MKIHFSLSKCKSKAAYSTKLKKRQRLNLHEISNNYEVVLETPILLVIKVENIEIIVHKHGELMFKNCFDTDLMERIAEEVYEVGLERSH